MKRTFDVTVTTYVTVSIDDEALKRGLDPEWQSQFYRFSDSGEVAGHIARNVAVKGLSLSSLDGWADLTDDMVEVVEYDEETEADEVGA